MENIEVNQQVAKLKHVLVYNRIFELIQDGTFPPGSQLPSEPDLAVQMGVSRMTLRKALALLKDDNLLVNVHGKGNFIKTDEKDFTYMDFSNHPILGSTEEKIETIECQFRIEPPTVSILQELGQKPAAVVIVDRWYKNTSDFFAYSLSFIPIEVVSENHIDLNCKDELLTFLQETIYEAIYDKEYVYSYSSSGNFSSVKYQLSDKKEFILIQEVIYINYKVVVSSRHFIPVNCFKMRMRSKRG